jgi:alpha-ribazole phosphatase
MPAAILIRHTSVAVARGICYGQSDVPPAATFAAEAAEVRARLPWVPTEVWSSPSARALRLAETLGAPAVRIDARLLELNFGDWETRAWESFHDAQSEAWARDPWNIRPPNGETAAGLHRRVGEIRAGLLSLLAASAGTGGGGAGGAGGAGDAGTGDDDGGSQPPPRIAIVTHAGVIRSWRAHAQARPLMELFSAAIPFGHVEAAG